MKQKFYHILISIVTTFVVAMFFSCDSNFEDIRKIDTTERFPGGIAENFTLIYTDSALIKATLTSPLNEDYSNQEFPFQEFPDGLQVDFFDKEKNKSTVTADYGIIYQATEMSDLRGHVVLLTHDGKKLETSQLYWDQKNQWVFTAEKFTFTNPEDGTIMNGEGIEFSQDFENGRGQVRAYKVDGVKDIDVEEDQEPLPSGEGSEIKE
ncbi:LPS export ABC transporter periplasmic protein LptC [Sinomicrobium oceani]|uniref:LPS export ABC transporter periplasmic protein LptC n=1 Tax=Sinomicrobium oceani TaxID=1150368 RepID=UPI00227BB11A|nr:LPS export ABC transporter periplasmic protein LptC [Sinomicrobium oceani]